MIYTLSEGHLLPMSTPATRLRRIGGVHSYHLSASLFRFAREVIEECRPRDITDRFRQAMVMNHPIHVQIFDADDPELIDKTAAVLMGEVLAPPRDTLMNTRDSLAVLASFWGAFGKPGVFPLDFGKSLFFGAEEARIGDLVSIGEHGKGFQSHVNPDALSVLRQSLRLSLTREAGVPFAGAALADGASLGRALHIPMEDDFDFAHFGEDQLPISDVASTGDLRKGHAIVAPIALEAWIAGFLTSFPTSKEGFHCQIDAHSNVLQDLRMHVVEGCTLLFQERIGIDLLVAGQAFARLLIGISTCCQQMIKEPATFFKLVLKDTLLLFRRVNPVLKHFMRVAIVA